MLVFNYKTSPNALGVTEVVDRAASYGKLVKQKRKARTGFNPKTQQKIKIPAKTVVEFRVAKAAKDAVLGVKK
jgi:nucleoid DNA-binding protein